MLSQVDAAAAAYEVPYDRYPAPGSRGLPLPRSIVEAMSFMAFARQQGVMSFWGRSPAVPDDKDFVVLHWPTEDGEQLKFRKNEVRCVLITSSTGPRMHMYAHLRPCESKEASGLLTVAAAAVRNRYSTPQTANLALRCILLKPHRRHRRRRATRPCTTTTR